MPPRKRNTRGAARGAVLKARRKFAAAPPQPKAKCPPASSPPRATGDFNFREDILSPVVGTFDPEFQTLKDTCALMAVRHILKEKNGKAPNEREMIPIGERSGGYEKCKGTTDEAAILREVGLPATTYYAPSLDAIADAVARGKGVIVGYDARPVWGDKSPKPKGHAVRVLEARRGGDGKVSELKIYDSAKGKSFWVSAGTFQQALDGFDSSRMTTTDQPLFGPTRIEADTRYYA